MTRFVDDRGEEHPASIADIIESSKDSEYRLQWGEQQ
jgi:hypothetical protein